MGRPIAPRGGGLPGHGRAGAPGGSLYEQTSRTARELKTFAKRHQVALVVLCQVDREGGNGGVPVTLRMARDSGVVEESADYLLGLWRPELAEGLSKTERLAFRGQFVIRVLKNRSGPAPKTVTLHFDPTSLRIEPGLPVAPAADEPAWVERPNGRGGVRYAKVSRVIWHDERFRAFTDDGSWPPVLLTHPALTSVGAMRGTVAGLAAELGWPVRRLERALGPVQQAGMVEINAPAAFIGLPKFLRHNPPDNPNVVKAWVSVVAEHVPECPERAALLHRCRAALTGAFLDAFDQAIGRTFPQGSGTL